MIAKFESLLKDVMGLDVTSVGRTTIERAVRDRVSACGLTGMDTYWDYVCGSEDELQELIEAVVVPETSFFRDREAFVALVRIAHEALLRIPPPGVLRLLSLPCSTGEEPYSMAMALLDAGLPLHRFRIDAVDISQRALAIARHAEYGKNSFRGSELAFRDHHFDLRGGRYRVHDTVREAVHFAYGNVFAIDFMSGAEPYNVIFCRNVLIYFDEKTQDSAINVIGRLLGTGGELFVGPSEASLLFRHGFTSSKIALAFAFRKGAPLIRTALAGPPPTTITRFAPLAPPRKMAPLRDLSAAPAPPAAVASTGMSEALQLADQGRFAEATRSCEEHVRVHGPSAAALHLLGLISNAAGNETDAAGYFRKTLYLEPDHHEALVHLAFLMEKRGDAQGALTLRKRRHRLEAKK